MKSKYEISKKYIKSLINISVDHRYGNYKEYSKSIQCLMEVLDEVKMCLSKEEENKLLQITRQNISKCFPTEHWTDENSTLSEIVNEFIKQL